MGWDTGHAAARATAVLFLIFLGMGGKQGVLRCNMAAESREMCSTGGPGGWDMRRTVLSFHLQAHGDLSASISPRYPASLFIKIISF